MTILLQNAVFGLLIGGLYGLGAVGLSLVFGVLAVLNVAHGELIMLGGYVSVWLFTLWRVDPFVSVLAAGPLLFLGGAALFRLLFTRLASYSEEVRIRIRSSSDSGWRWCCRPWPSSPGEPMSGPSPRVTRGGLRRLAMLSFHCLGSARWRWPSWYSAACTSSSRAHERGPPSARRRTTTRPRRWSGFRLGESISPHSPSAARWPESPARSSACQMPSARPLD